MKKLLIVCGPTATGKTALAIKLAKKFNGEIVSADSRQVYKNMDIGTGKDLPAGSQFQKAEELKSKTSNIGYYLISGIRVWGYDFVSPKKKFSVSQYIDAASKIIANIYKRKKLPILVGGTGLYIKGVVDGIETSTIVPDSELRKSLEKKPVTELFELLAAQDPIKAASMNSSDKKNPRRLVRAIEIAKSKARTVDNKIRLKNLKDVLIVGLTTDKVAFENRIVVRVNKRLKAGIEKEISKLLEDEVSWEMQSMRALGYGEWKNYFAGDRSEQLKTEAISKWTTNEIKYIKRQLTWFKKDKRVNWFDVSENGFGKRVEKLVEKWQN